MRTAGRSALLGQLVPDGSSTSQQTILTEIRRAILAGGVPPNTPIPLNEVAARFGVSQIPVREALKTLVGEGLVTQRPNSGYVVAHLTPEELQELYVVRETLESAALANAVVNASEEERQLAREINERLERAIEANDAVAYHRDSRAFHLALTGPSRMHRLLHMLGAAWNVTEPVQAMVHVAAHQRAQLHTDHGVMLDAFLTRDTERLLAAARAHSDRLNAVIATVPTDLGLIS